MPFCLPRSAQSQARVQRSRRFRIRLIQAILGVLLLMVSIQRIRAQFLPPQAIFVLGGAVAREEFAAQLAQQEPELEIWISSGSHPETIQQIFLDAGVNLDRLHLDYRAVDTVTNFTTLADDFQAQGIQCVYLITSDYHMRRARVIGEIVFGSRGIVMKPLPVASKQSEPWEKSLRDGARSILWVITGRTGSSLHRYLPSEQD